MPAILGAMGYEKTTGATLIAHYENEFSTTYSVRLRDDAVLLGGHSHHPTTRVGRSGRAWFAADGEYSVYKALAGDDGRPAEGEPLFRLERGRFLPSDDFRGNLLVYDEVTGAAFLYRSASSCFPLYFAASDAGLLVSTLLRPLARTVGAEIDHVGMLEYLMKGYTIGNRTLFQGISELSPGQVLSYDLTSRRHRITEFSVERKRYEGLSFEDTVDALCEILKPACHRAVELASPEKHALMLSAGWDSRVLFAMLAADNGPGVGHCVGYENSIKRSREIAIVERMCRDLGQPFLDCKVKLNLTDTEFFRELFGRSEVCCYPEWYVVGRTLRDRGVEVASCGILGEIVGGHYGSSFFANRLHKGLSYLSFVAKGTTEAVTVDEAKQRLIRHHSIVPWYYTTEYRSDHPALLERVRSDILGEVERLRSCGVVRGEEVLEAFVSQHRGIRHVAEQALSLRGAIDIEIPFGHRDLVALGTAIPFEYKVQNKLSRAVVKRLRPELMAHPTAAVLLPARSPILLQELSRVALVLLERVSTIAHSRSKGRIDHFMQSYRNSEYLRKDDSFFRLLEQYQMRCFDRKKYIEFLENVVSYKRDLPISWVFGVMMMMLRVDLMYRR